MQTTRTIVIYLQYYNAVMQIEIFEKERKYNFMSTIINYLIQLILHKQNYQF